MDTEKITQIQVSKATRDMVKKLAVIDRRNMTQYLETLVEREFERVVTKK